MKIVIDIPEARAKRIRAAFGADIATPAGVEATVSDEYIADWLKNHLRNLTIAHETAKHVHPDAGDKW